jgi:hypothetical protein
LAVGAFPDIFPEMDARTKAVKSHRKRLRARGMKRVEVTVRAENVPLLRDVAAKLRETSDVKRIQAALALPSSNKPRSLADALYDPIVADPKFDDIFEQIERSRHDPEMMKTRDIDL